MTHTRCQVESKTLKNDPDYSGQCFGSTSDSNQEGMTSLFSPVGVFMSPSVAAVLY